MIRLPRLVAASLTYIGGKPVSVLTLQCDPRDVEAIASGCELLAELGCQLEAADQLRKLEPEPAEPAPASAPASDAAPKQPRELADDSLVIHDGSGRPIGTHE